MNIRRNYENLMKAKESIEKFVNEGIYDQATKARLNNVLSRIELTLIEMRIEIEGDEEKID